MRRFLAVLMMLMCLLFAGCGKETDHMQSALDFRSALLNAEGCQFTCHVEADYGDRVYSFSLKCLYDGDDGEIWVLAPETIAGITAEIDGENATLSFDGACLEFGKLANGYVAPLTIPWLLGSAWAGDYIALAGADGEMSRITWRKGYHEEELDIDTWLQDGAPVYAEVSYDGRRALSVTIQDFAFLK